MQADIYNTPVATVAASEGPAFGAALMAGVGSGVFSDLVEATDRCVRVTGIVQPNPREVARYGELGVMFRSLYPDLKDAFARAQAMVDRQSRLAE
jgi:xylulokinase